MSSVYMISDTALIVVSVVSAITCIIALKLGAGSGVTFKRRMGLERSYARELETELDRMKKENLSLKRLIGNREAAPTVRGDMGDLASAIPELLPMISHKLPKWMVPLASNPMVIKSLTEFAQKNPDKINELLGKVVNVKGNPKTNEPEGVVI